MTGAPVPRTAPRPLPAPPPPRASRHVPALDGLRGAAVAGVVLFHAGVLPGGFLGVDLFFVLSGFLITDQLLREARRTGTISLVAFWGRRARRLLPALVLLLVGALALVVASGSRDLARSTLADGPWVQASVQNWHLLAQDASYWDRTGPGRVLAHLWSVAVEEQFYLLWPAAVLLMVVQRRRTDLAVLLLAGALAAASLITMALLLDPADPTRVYTGTDTRAASLLVGACAATAPVRAVAVRLRRRAAVVAPVLVTVLLVSWTLVDGHGAAWLYRGGLGVHATAWALVVVLVARSPRTTVARGLAWRPLRWLGSVSYGLYLWHWPLLVLAPVLLPGASTPARTAVAVAGAVGVAALSRRLVEDPVRFTAGWAHGRRGLVVTLGVTVAVAALWFAVPAPAAPVVDVSLLR